LVSGFEVGRLFTARKALKTPPDSRMASDARHAGHMTGNLATEASTRE
jgi:hypothetical protein